jgi:glycosyltransferase involved in cell wall biosynthesis
MKVSIITVTYNSGKYLENCINSVLNQNYLNIEFIIVDGNSTDCTIDIIHKYQHRISKYISEPDSGLYDAMNKGIRLATGDLIGILNSDDIFYNNSVIGEIVHFHKKYSIQASIGNIVQHDSYGKISRFYSSKNWSPVMLKIGFMPPHPSIFFQIDLFEKYGFYNLGFKIAADYELITRFFLKNNISWKYSGLTTTSMMIGGKSSSGYTSYRLITNEIITSLKLNGVRPSVLVISLRFIWKSLGLIKGKISRIK